MLMEFVSGCTFCAGFTLGGLEKSESYIGLDLGESHEQDKPRRTPAGDLGWAGALGVGCLLGLFKAWGSVLATLTMLTQVWCL